MGTAPTIKTTGLPSGTAGTPYSQPLDATGDATITWTLGSGGLPGGLSLSSDGVISGTPAAAGTFGFTVKASNNAGNHTQALSIKVDPAAPLGTAPSITTANLTNGFINVNYSQTLSAAGDTPITWEVVIGSLPNGLRLSSDGVISGMPTVAGTFNFTVNASNFMGNDTKALAIVINPVPVATVNYVTINTSPIKTTYTAGEVLDLTGLAVTLHKSDGTTEDVLFANFAAKNITVNPANNTVLTTANVNITIIYTPDNVSVNQPIWVNSATATVTGVSITPSDITLQQGDVYQFAATVTGTNNPSQSVEWGVSGNNDSGTVISSAGLLTVAANETGEGLTVIATSTADTSKFGVAAVTVALTTQTHTITYNANGGSGKMQSGTVTHGGNHTAAENGFYYMDYSFVGWNTHPYGSGTAYSAGATVYNVQSDITLFAQWSWNGGNGGNDNDNDNSGNDNDNSNSGNSGNNGNNIGNNGSGGNQANGGANSSGVTTAPETGEKVELKINGTTVTAELSADGTLTIIYTETDIAEYKDKSGEYVISIPDQNSFELNIPITVLDGDRLVIETDFGTVEISAETLQAIQRLTGGTLRLVITKGSFHITLLNSDGKEVAYNDPANPFVITLPYALKDWQNAVNIVAVKDTGVGYTVLPFAVYKNGQATFEIYATGTYDLMDNNKAFTDISSHWAVNYISFVTAREIFNGMGNGQFSPEGSMTRAMFVMALANLDGVDLSGYTASCFNDVQVGAWYASAVEWAADSGIVSGYDGKFAPDAQITREQMAVMLHNYMNYKGYSAPSGMASAFADEDSISSWAYDAIKVMRNMGVISGKPGNLYDPKPQPRARKWQRFSLSLWKVLLA